MNPNENLIQPCFRVDLLFLNGGKVNVKNPYSYTLMNKHNLKLLMVQLIQKSFETQLSEQENLLNNVLRRIVCLTGFFEEQIS